MGLVLFFIMWVSGVELREAGLVISAFVHSHLTSLKFLFVQIYLFDFEVFCLPVCMPVHHPSAWCPGSSEEGVRSPRAKVTDRWFLADRWVLEIEPRSLVRISSPTPPYLSFLYKCQGLNPHTNACALQTHYELMSSEPPPFFFFLFCWSLLSNPRWPLTNNDFLSTNTTTCLLTFF